jgi:hypothetical protein
MFTKPTRPAKFEADVVFIEKSAREIVGAKDAAAIAREVDFATEYLVLYRWTGWGAMPKTGCGSRSTKRRTDRSWRSISSGRNRRRAWPGSLSSRSRAFTSSRNTGAVRQAVSSRPLGVAEKYRTPSSSELRATVKERKTDLTVDMKR